MKESKKSLFDICSDLNDITAMLDRADAVSCNLCSGYFGYNAEHHRKNKALELITDYEESRNFAEIISDYIIRAREMVEKLMGEIKLDPQEE